MRHFLAIAALSVCAVAHCLPSSAESADRAASYLAECMAKTHLFLWNDAMKACEKAIHANPGDAEAYYELGYATSWYADFLDKPDKKQAAYQDTIDEFTKAISLKPDYIEAYVGRGYQLRAKGNTAGAMADFTRAIDLAGSGWCQCPQTKWRVLADRAALRQSAGDLNGALADYGAAIEASQEKDASALYLKRAELEKSKGDLAGAAQDLTWAIRLNGGTDAYRARSAIKFAKGDTDGAIADLNTALLVDPCSAAADSDRIPMRKARGDAAGAQSDEASAKQFSDTSACEQSMNFVAGTSGFDILIAVNDAHGNGLYPKDSAVARAFLAQKQTALEASAKKDIGNKNWDLAVFDLTKAIKLGMNDPHLFLNRGTMRRFRGDADGGMADFSEAIEISEENPSMLNGVPTAAFAHFVRGEAEDADFSDTRDAIADYDKALQLAPNAPGFLADAYVARAFTRQRQGDLDGAIADSTKAIQLMPSDAGAFALRAQLKQAKGDARGAQDDQAAADKLKAVAASAK